MLTSSYLIFSYHVSATILTISFLHLRHAYGQAVSIHPLASLPLLFCFLTFLITRTYQYPFPVGNYLYPVSTLSRCNYFLLFSGRL